MQAAVLCLYVVIAMVLVASILFTLLDRSSQDTSALARADALLRRHLSEDEQHQLQRSGIVQIRSSQHAGRVYHVRADGGRVTVRTNGCMEMELCVRPATMLPGREGLLAHKLMIQAAEDDYLARANVVWRGNGHSAASSDAWWSY